MQLSVPSSGGEHGSILGIGLNRVPWAASGYPVIPVAGNIVFFLFWPTESRERESEREKNSGPIGQVFSPLEERINGSVIRPFVAGHNTGMRNLSLIFLDLGP